MLLAIRFRRFKAACIPSIAQAVQAVFFVIEPFCVSHVGDEGPDSLGDAATQVKTRRCPVIFCQRQTFETIFSMIAYEK